jgi:hypothetical protein
MSDHERIRLVILGGAGVGKSCIVKRFLFNTFTDKYRSTVEDLYNREYDLGPVTLKVSNQLRSWTKYSLKYTAFLEYPVFSSLNRKGYTSLCVK